MFNPMNFENQFIVIEDTGESVLADSKFCERAASEWLEELRPILHPFCPPEPSRVQ